MSSFVCPYCGTSIIDTPYGYVTGCEHYPLEGDRNSGGDGRKSTDGLDIVPLEWASEDVLPHMTDEEYDELFESSRPPADGESAGMHPFVQIGGKPVWVTGLGRLYDSVRKEADREAMELWHIIADIRAACGDDGRRMMPDLLKYLGGLFETLNRILFGGLSKSECMDAAQKALDYGQGGKFLVTTYSAGEEGCRSPRVTSRIVEYASLNDLLFHEHPYGLYEAYSSPAELMEIMRCTVWEALEDAEDDRDSGMLVYRINSDGERADAPVFSDIAPSDSSEQN